MVAVWNKPTRKIRRLRAEYCQVVCTNKCRILISFPGNRRRHRQSDSTAFISRFCFPCSRTFMSGPPHPRLQRPVDGSRVSIGRTEARAPLHPTAAGRRTTCRHPRRVRQNVLGLDSVGPRDREAPETPVLFLSETSGRRRAEEEAAATTSPALRPLAQPTPGTRPLSPGHATRAAPDGTPLPPRRRRARPISRCLVFYLLGFWFGSAPPVVASQAAGDRFLLARPLPLARISFSARNLGKRCMHAEAETPL